MKIKRAAKYGMWGIVAFDEQGYEWVLKHQFPTDSAKLYQTLERIRAKLVIDTNHWYKRKRNNPYAK